MAYIKRYKSKEECMKDNSFNSAGNTFVVVGRNTFAVKDELKEAGCRYSADLGWHSDVKVSPLPAECQCVEVKFDDIYVWDQYSKIPVNKIANMKAFVRSLYKIENSKSTYIGEIGERVRDLEVTLIEVKECPKWDSRIYVFKNGDNILTWFTSCVKSICPGDTVTLTGTVKKHDQWSGEPATALSRCIIK